MVLLGAPTSNALRRTSDIRPGCWQVADFQALRVASELDSSGHKRSESIA